jgi:hypothetical protein
MIKEARDTFPNDTLSTYTSTYYIFYKRSLKELNGLMRQLLLFRMRAERKGLLGNGEHIYRRYLFWNRKGKLAKLVNMKLIC